jgi:hypothetical protein
MPEKIRVFESEIEPGKVQKLQANPKRDDPARERILPLSRQQIPLTRELILRLIELIKQV